MMIFRDERVAGQRSDDYYLLRLALEILVRESKNPHFSNSAIIVADHDPKLGNINHLQMNFHPNLDDEFVVEWVRITGMGINLILLENTAWKRYAWGVYLDKL